MPLTIITEPNPILHKKAKEIKKEELKSPEIKELILGMKEMVETAGGVGLAAPQVAKSLRLIVIFLDNKKLILLNPEITKYSWRKDCAEEGCLSVPGNFGKVKRSKIIIIHCSMIKIIILRNYCINFVLIASLTLNFSFRIIVRVNQT